MKKGIEVATTDKIEAEAPNDVENEQSETKRKLTNEIYEKIVEENEKQGILFKDLCKRYGVSESSLYFRRSKDKKRKSQANVDTQVKDVSEGISPIHSNNRIKDLEAELSYWKNKFTELQYKHDLLVNKKS